MTPLQNPNHRRDQELLCRFQQNHDQAALQLLCQRHHGIIAHAVQRFGYPVSEEDFATDIYLTLYTKLPTCGEVRNFPAWLKTLTHNRLRDLLRREGSADKYRDYCMEHEPQSYEVSSAEMADLKAMVQWGLGQLSDQEAECLYLRYYGDMSYREIAEALGLTFKQVCGRIERGLRKLRQCFGQAA